MKNIILIISLLTLWSCSNKNKTEEKPAGTIAESVVTLTDAQLKSFTISTVQLQEQTISTTLKLNGKVDVPPQNLVSVSAALGGYLKSTKLLPGSHFNKGEILAVLEDNQYIQLQQDYLTTKAQLQNATAEYHRQKELNQSKASSDKVYQQAQAEYESLLISKSALEEKLRLIHINPNLVAVDKISRTVNIYAPFEGYVTRIFVNTGKYIAPSDVLFELVDPSDLHLNLKVFENDWSKIKIGQPIEAYTNSNPNNKYSGKIILIGKNISEDRAVEMHAHFDKYDPLLIPGMYMNADLVIPNNSTKALPEDCIVSFEGKHYVFKSLAKNRFEMIEVQTGSTGNGWIEIENADALQNATIVHNGAYTLLMTLKNKAEE